MHGRRLHAVPVGNEQGPDASPTTGEPDREDSPDGLDLSIQRQLADNREGPDGAGFHATSGGENAEGDREIERGAFLTEVSRSKVDRDAVLGKGEAGVADGRAHAFAALAHGGVGEAHGGEHGQTRRHVDFDADERGFHSDQSGRQHAGQHESDCSA